MLGKEEDGICYKNNINEKKILSRKVYLEFFKTMVKKMKLT